MKFSNNGLGRDAGRLELPNGSALDVCVRAGGGTVAWSDVDDALELRGTFPSETRDEHDEQNDATFELTVRHPLVNPEHVWVPHLTPEDGNVMGDAVFRSPAIVLAGGEMALAFIPNLDDVAGAVGFRVWLDYDHPQRALTVAAGAYREEGHVFYVRERPRTRGQAVRLRLHVIASRDPRDLENPYGMAARWIWSRWGRRGFERAKTPRLAPLMDHIVRWAFSHDGWGESVWQPVELTPEGAGAPVFIVDVTRHPSVPPEQRQWREPRSIWNQVWFSTQRCANGLLRYARQIGSADLEDRARRMTEIALAAPQEGGLFPARLVSRAEAGARADDWRWSNSDRRPPSVSEDACHIVDAAFTCRMLLEWHALTGDERARAYVIRFADRLVTLQRPSGAFPGWVEPDGASGESSGLADGPESAVAAALLFELARSAERAGGVWREAALAALPFLEDVTRKGRWEDFETYYSCARWGADRTPNVIGKRVARNGVYKQNTLSIAWCARAFLEGFRATHHDRYLVLARRCIDELSLYQAVWDPPFLPAPAHGGFGVMNADSEWNDARQSLFAPLFLELGRETGDPELTERGISALRASFSMLYCPENAELARAYEQRFPFFGPETYGFMMENQGHSGADPIGPFTIFTWGNGSALAAAATVRDRFPEVIAACGLE